jgi:peptidoglycan/xylan/chitin deacetylase (PgdA/CDA1 family)
MLAGAVCVVVVAAAALLDDSEPAPNRRTATHKASRRRAAAPRMHRASHEAVPILMYHVINAPPPGTPVPALWVPRGELAAEMKYLADQGYHAVTLQQVWDAWKRGGLLPAKPIVISFDDGYLSDYTNALPILREHGWPGVLNLEVNQTREDLRPDRVKALIAAGWEVDAHTISHADLTSVDDATLEREVSGSRQQIQQQYGVPVNFFCYPAGRFDERVIRAVRPSGYLGATTTEDGLASPRQDPYELHRIRVSGGDGVEGLARALSAAE